MSGVTAEAIDQLGEMSGSGPWKVRTERALNWLKKVDGEYWRRKEATGRIYRFLTNRQRPDVEEVEHIRRAHVLFAPEKIEANRAQNSRLIESLRTYIDTAMASDPEFFGPQVEIIREVLGERGDQIDPSSGSGRSTD